VPDDDQDGPGDGTVSFIAADPPGQAAVPFAEEGGGVRGAGGGLGAVALEVDVAAWPSRRAIRSLCLRWNLGAST
jgi:hypothetical protein